MSLYLMGVYCGCGDTTASGATGDAKWFQEAWRATGKKLDMGRACVSFKTIEGVPLDVVGEAIRRVPAKTYIERYLATLGAGKAARTR